MHALDNSKHEGTSIITKTSSLEFYLLLLLSFPCYSARLCSVLSWFGFNSNLFLSYAAMSQKAATLTKHQMLVMTERAWAEESEREPDRWPRLLWGKRDNLPTTRGTRDSFWCGFSYNAEAILKMMDNSSVHGEVGANRDHVFVPWLSRCAFDTCQEKYYRSRLSWSLYALLQLELTLLTVGRSAPKSSERSFLIMWLLPLEPRVGSRSGAPRVWWDWEVAWSPFLGSKPLLLVSTSSTVLSRISDIP